MSELLTCDSYAIVGTLASGGEYLIDYTIRRTPEQSKARFMRTSPELSWKEAKKKGYRVSKVSTSWIKK